METRPGVEDLRERGAALGIVGHAVARPGEHEVHALVVGAVRLERLEHAHRVLQPVPPRHLSDQPGVDRNRLLLDQVSSSRDDGAGTAVRAR